MAANNLFSFYELLLASFLVKIEEGDYYENVEDDEEKKEEEKEA